MSIPPKPAVRPADPRFSSGPTRKRPGWSVDALEGAALGRSHRSKAGKAKLKEAIDRTRALLGVPAEYKIGITPASDTGAIEMAMWTMLGARPVDVFAWESFGEEWVRFDLMFAGIVCFAVLGFASDRTLMAIRRRVLKGHLIGTEEQALR